MNLNEKKKVLLEKKSLLESKITFLNTDYTSDIFLSEIIQDLKLIKEKSLKEAFDYMVRKNVENPKSKTVLKEGYHKLNEEAMNMVFEKLDLGDIFGKVKDFFTKKNILNLLGEKPELKAAVDQGKEALSKADAGDNSAWKDFKNRVGTNFYKLVVILMLAQGITSNTLAQDIKGKEGDIEKTAIELAQDLGGEKSLEGEDLLGKFDRLLKQSMSQNQVNSYEILNKEPHSITVRKTKVGEPGIQTDTINVYVNKDQLNPNVDLKDIKENLDSKVIQQKYNWVISNMRDINVSPESFDETFELVQQEFNNRFPDSKLNVIDINGNKTVVFDHVFKQSDGFAQGPKNYKTDEGTIIRVGQRIPKGSHVIDFYAGDIKDKETQIATPGEKTSEEVKLVQVRAKPITIEYGDKIAPKQKEIKKLKQYLSQFGEVNDTGRYLVLDPSMIKFVDSKDADKIISDMNSTMGKLAKSLGFSTNGDMFSRADSVGK